MGQYNIRKKILCVLQARMGSTRLPGKVMMDICGRPMLYHIIERLRRAMYIDEIIIATTTKVEDNVIVELAEKLGVNWYRGEENDVVKRISNVIDKKHHQIIIHATGDNPLVSPEIVDFLVGIHKSQNYDFTFMKSIPLGIGVDIYNKNTILKINDKATSPSHREHLNAYIFDNLNKFFIGDILDSYYSNLPMLRLTVDTYEDLRLIREIYSRLWRPGIIVSLKEVFSLYKKVPSLFDVNKNISQKYVSYKAKLIRLGFRI